MKLGHCGIDCASCPAFIAHRDNNDSLREETAIQWSKQYQADIKPK